MDVLIADDGEARVMLTTDAAASSYGGPVLRVIAAGECMDYGPGDVLGDVDRPDTLTTAASIVATWAADRLRTPDARRAAHRFCAQWPGGPQVTPPT